MMNGSIVSDSLITKESPGKLKCMDFFPCRVSLEFYIHSLYEYEMDNTQFVAQIENCMISMTRDTIRMQNVNVNAVCHVIH